MAQKVRFILDIDERGIVRGSRKAERSVKGLDNQIDRTKRSTSGLQRAWQKFGKVIAGLAVFELVRRGFTQMIRKGKEFEQQLADLSAITGIQGESLDFLGDAALETSSKFGESAANIVEAQKLVASQLAQQIDFGTQQGLQELRQISDEAVKLQKAAGVDLNTAVTALTTSINQFNLEASETPRIVNAIAAGAKFGAAEATDQALALKEAGTVAASANISFEELNSAIQVLAANGIKGSRAGVALRNIITRLQTRADKLANAGITDVNVKSQSMVETFQQLQPLMGQTSEITEIFGERAQAMASILIGNVANLEDMNQKLHTQGVAAEQVATQLDTFEGASDQLSQTFNNKLIGAFQESNGVMVKMLKNVTSLIDAFAGGIHQINVWTDSTHDIKRATQAAIGTSNSQLAAIQKTRQEIVEFAQANDLTDQQMQKLDDTLQASTDTLSKYIAQLFESRKQTKQQRDALLEQKEAVEDATGRFEGWTQAARDARLNFINERLQGLNKSIKIQSAQMKRLKDEYQAGAMTAEEFVKQAIAAQEAVDAGEDGGGAGGEATGIASKIKAAKEQAQGLLNIQGDLNTAQQTELRGLLLKIQRLERIQELRQQQATPLQGAPEAETDAFGAGQAGGIQNLGTEAQQQEKLKQKTVELTEAERKRAEAAAEGSKKAADAKGAELSMTEQVAEAGLRAAAASIARGESFGETIRNVLQGLVAEVVALQVRNVFATVPFPLNVAIAGAAAAGAQALFNQVVPEFQRGGLPEGGIGAAGLTTGGQKMISINEDKRPEFIVNAETTRRALPLLEALNSNPNLAGALAGGRGSGASGGIGGGSGVDSEEIGSIVERAIIKGMRKSSVRFDLNEFNETNDNFKQLQNRIGNG